MRALLALVLAAPSAAGSVQPTTLEPIAPINFAFADILDAKMQAALEDEVRNALAPRGYELLLSQTVGERLRAANAPTHCLVGPCLAQVGKALDVRIVLIGGVEGEGTSFNLHLTVLGTEQGQPIAGTSERCDLCTFDEAKDLLRRLAEALGDQLLKQAPPAAGGAALVEPEAAVEERAPGPTSPTRVWEGWKWVALGAGIVSLSVGAALLHVENTCADGDPCTEFYSTGGAGMAFVAIGAAAVGTSGLMFVLGY